MLTGQGLLCFAPEPWDSMWRSRQFIMAELSKHNKVLFVEPRTYLRDAVRAVARGKISLADVARPSLRRVSPNLYTFLPPVLAPVSGRFPLSTMTDLIRTSLLKLAMRRIGIEHPILWLERPDVWDQVGKFDEKLLVYRVTDEYTAYVDVTPATRALIESRERYLLARADLVLVASDSLLATKAPFNPSTFLLSHGVDFAAHVQVGTNSDAAPPDISNLPRPIVGYVGLVGRRLDLELLGRLAGSRPSWSLIFVGDVNPLDCESELTGLREMSNVHFLGRKKVREVPSYIHAFDVCLVPYRQGPDALNANPLKLLEYLACGKPTVSIDTPAVRSFGQLIKIAGDADSFLSCLEAALCERDEGLAERRREVARGNSWGSVAERLSLLIEARVRAKQIYKETCLRQGRT
ncbi:MAG: glycosyltransferase [Chloroflexi bacterium]|nr:glycosyltransferase [Chloroflexota bacterium]